MLRKSLMIWPLGALTVAAVIALRTCSWVMPNRASLRGSICTRMPGLRVEKMLAWPTPSMRDRRWATIEST